MLKIVAATVVLFVLAGCSPRDLSDMVEYADRLDCRDMGAPPGSRDYHECREELEWRRRHRPPVVVAVP